jgi:hypothetical protein
MIYLKVARMVMVQNIQDNPPNTSSGVMGFLPNIAAITYKGDVPISPNTMPSVIRRAAPVTLVCSDFMLLIAIVRSQGAIHINIKGLKRGLADAICS